VLVPVPRDIEALLGANQDAALAWRLATREAIMHYLALGYQVTAFDRGSETELPAYELTHSPSRPA
jgi:predicted GNAT superfamily acetyltransferase